MPTPKSARPEAKWSDSVSKRLFRRLKISDNGCWEWTGAIGTHGYGMIGVSSYVIDTVPRVAWRLLKGPIENNLWVLHKCDNKKCFNPEHLYLGTVIDNARDAIERGLMVCRIQDYKTPEMEAKRVAHLKRGSEHPRPA